MPKISDFLVTEISLKKEIFEPGNNQEWGEKQEPKEKERKRYEHRNGQKDCGFPKWGEECHQQCGGAGRKAELGTGGAVAGARNGVSKKYEMAASKLSREWPRAALECQPGTGTLAVAGVSTKPLMIVTNIRCWSHSCWAAWQSWGRAVPGSAVAR